ncbi:MAG: hypothetical protein IJB16_06395 [Clostridia bacterium]|nr:hypothetical protein [Clostridia bacterium]
MEILNFLKANIKSDTALLTIVDTFSRMCRREINGKDEIFLFESGPVTHNGKLMLMFSLVRQFSDGNDEPIQIHTDIIYNPNESNKKLSACSWHENYEDFIQTVLLSKAFETCKILPIEKLDIWAEKT